MRRLHYLPGLNRTTGMSPKLLLASMLAMFPLFLLAQGTKAKGGGGAATTGTPTASPAPATAGAGSQSGASQVEQGYHYVLPAYSFLKYGVIDSTVTPSGFLKAPPSQITLIRIVSHRHIRSGALTCNGCIDSGAVIDTISECITTCVMFGPAYVRSVCDSFKYYTTVTTVVHIDSLDRYYPLKRHISLTQGDSGLLAIGMGEDYLGDSVKHAPSHRQQHFFQTVSGSVGSVLKGSIDWVAAPTQLAPRSAKGSPQTPTVYQKKFYKRDDTLHRAILLGPHDTINNLSLRVNPKITFDNTTYYIRLHYRVFQTGALTIPYKYHFGYRQHLPNGGGQDTIPNDLSVNINVSLAAGMRYGRTRFYYDQSKTYNGLASFFGVFAGPTQIQLSSTNTFSGSPKTSNQLGLSTGVCALMELKNINFGVFGGFDFPVTTNGSDWFYSNRIWLGFGVGVNLAMFTSAIHQPL